MLARFPHHGFFGQPTAADRREVDRALAMTSLSDLRSRGLGELSAGERQRTAVARAIAQGAKVMLLDEPTAFLDIYHRVMFFEIVTRLSKSVITSYSIHYTKLYENCPRGSGSGRPLRGRSPRGRR